MNKNIVFPILFIVLTVNLMVVSFNVGYYSSKKINKAINYSENTECTSLDLFNTSYCLRDKLISFYKYNKSNIGKELSLNDLKYQGGVCYHYSKWYYNQINKSNFYKDEVLIDVNKNTTHIFTIASDSLGYCILDQTYVICIPFE